MKWAVTIRGLDLGGMLPPEDELRPHDYPIENWAAAAISNLFRTMRATALEECLKVRTDWTLDELTKEAAARHYKEVARTAAHMAEHFTFEQEAP